MAHFLAYLRQAWDIPGATARRWSNVFHLNSTDLAAATADAQALWINYLRAAARERVYCYETYVTSFAALDEVFNVTAVPEGSQRGSLVTPSTGADPYLSKACVAVTLNVSGSRPSRKFWRPGIYEGDITNGQSVGATLAAAIQGAFDNAIADLGANLTDPQGAPFTGVGRLRLTTREFGRESTADVPLPPPFG